MADEITPNSVATDGNLLVCFVPSGQDPHSIAVLNAETTKKITYSLTPSGFNRTTTEQTVDDPRLTLKQLLQRAGQITEGLEVQYVFGDANDIAAKALIEGQSGNIVARYAKANGAAFALTDKPDIIPITCGRQRKDAPTANGVFTKTQTLYVTGVVENEAQLVA